MALIATILSAGANAADTYGYLAMWQNPHDGNDALLIKTTKENMSQIEANAELEAFCRGQDTLSACKTARRQAVNPLFRFITPASPSHTRNRKAS